MAPAAPAVEAPASAQAEPAPSPPEPVPDPEPPVQVALPDYRYLGHLVDLSGQRRVFVTSGQQHAELYEGQALPDGYRVESVGPPAIRLRQAQTVVEIPWTSAVEPAR